MVSVVVSISRPVVQNVVGVMIGLSEVTGVSRFVVASLKRSSIMVRTLSSI